MFTPPPFFKTGHRGCRGLLPENTLQGFINAIALNVNTIELDVIMSQDEKLVVSHEPYMNPEICLTPDNKEIPLSQSKAYNLYQMPYAEIKRFDCGSKQHPRFQQQQNFPTCKPLLSETIETIEQYCLENKLNPIVYDIEIKSEELEYGISQPEPSRFVEKLVQCIQCFPIENRLILRSFDKNQLKYLNQQYPTIPLAYIVENGYSAEKNITELGFIPYMYSPDYTMLSEEDMRFLKAHNCLVVPWTINTLEEMKTHLKLGVNGIITDYPNLFQLL